MVFNKDDATVRVASAVVASCVSEIVTLPVDIIKLRLQLQSKTAATASGVLNSSTNAAQPFLYTGSLDCVQQIARFEGPAALWKGLIPAMVRQVISSSLCMLLFYPARNAICTSDEIDGHVIPLYKRLLAAGVTGGTAIILANPADVIKVRMQANSTINGAAPRYLSMTHAIRSILRSEGASAFASGLLPNVQRGIVVNAAELGTYDHAKNFFIYSVGLDDGLLCHASSSFVAAFFSSTASNPVDVIKSRLMTQPTGQGRIYNGMIDCARKTFVREGFLAFYQGWFPNWMRKVPWCVTFFICYERCREIISRI